MLYFAKFTFIFIILLTPFCDRQKIERGIKMETEESLNKSVKLSGKVERKDGVLSIKYELTNQTPKKIYVYDLIPIRGEDGEEIKHDLAYRCYEEPDTLRVVRAVLPLPTDREVFMKEIPYVRPVEPNKSVSGQIVLPAPVLEYNPYYPPMNLEDQKEVSINKIKLIIGWTEVRSGMDITDTNVGGEEVQMIRGAWEAPLYRLAETTFSADAKMKVRNEPFDRRLPEH